MSSYRANRNGNYSSEKDHANKNNAQNVKNADVSSTENLNTVA